MFDFGNANDGQRKAISAAEGPVLITAGPGTGKTYTLVQRTIYLIEECNVKPESIFVATFTEKAAKELITRITNELSNRGIAANINEMYIGTFHSLCLRILKEHLEYTRLRRNYRLLDAFDQQYMVFQNIHRFRSIPQIEIALPNGGAWKQAAAICNYVNNLSEELVTPEELMADADQSIAALGRMLKEYRDILAEGNLMDFSSIQIEAYHLLRENEEILDELRSQITHLMVDEYQDTNFIQEQLVFLLAGDRKNICVVGDDDQGLYRFRGATIRNILEFPQKFADGECRIIPLVVNYRSNSDIVDFYNRWMATTDGAKFKFSWDNFRYAKQIEPHEKTLLHSPAVVKLASDNDPDEWHEKILNFINDLTLKRVWHEYTLHQKEYSKPVDFKLVEADLSKYASTMYERGSLALDTTVKEKNVDYLQENMKYSEFTLVGEVARYLNISCILVAKILRESVDGIDVILNAVNRYNAVLDDYIVPGVFHALFEIVAEQKTEDKELVLLREPKDAGYYEFSAQDDLVITNRYPGFTPEQIKKSFHADTYCFDSLPEKECFMQYITSGKVKEVYFTGMFTSNQGDLYVHYYDPESGRIRQYYPDFLAKMDDGSYQLIEVKGDNKIDDTVVKAKQAAAEEMAIASGIKYLMYAGSQIVNSHVLEDASDTASTISMC